MTLRLTMASRWIPVEHEEEESGIGTPEGVSGHAAQSRSNDGSSVMTLGGWQLHRAMQCCGRQHEGIKDATTAEYWLRTQSRRPLAVCAMRRVLQEEGQAFLISRWRDDDVISQVARLIGRGLWHVCEPVMRVYPVSAAAEPAVVFAPPRRGSSASGPSWAAPPPVPEPPPAPTLAPNADQAAMAAVLTDASQSGVPFCEECAKAAAARAAPATR